MDCVAGIPFLIDSISLSPDLKIPVTGKLESFEYLDIYGLSIPTAKKIYANTEVSFEGKYVKLFIINSELRAEVADHPGDGFVKVSKVDGFDEVMTADQLVALCFVISSVAPDAWFYETISSRRYSNVIDLDSDFSYARIGHLASLLCEKKPIPDDVKAYLKWSDERCSEFLADLTIVSFFYSNFEYFSAFYSLYEASPESFKEIVEKTKRKMAFWLHK